MFDYQDEHNFSWFNLGGWDNAQHAVEQTIGGVRSTLVSTAASKPIENGRAYDIRIEKRGAEVKCYLDGTLLFDTKLPDGRYDRAIYTSAALTKDGKQLIVKLTNPNPMAAPAHLTFANGKPVSASLEILSSADGLDENTTSDPTHVVPRTDKMKVNRNGSIDYTVPAFSLNILTIQLK